MGCVLAPPAAPGEGPPASPSAQQSLALLWPQSPPYLHVAALWLHASAFALLSLITTLVIGFRAHPDDLG